MTRWWCPVCCGESVKVIAMMGTVFPSCGGCLARCVPIKDPTCTTCNDLHKMALTDHGPVPCTRCPTPCADCRGRLTAYCATTPCVCACHALRKPNQPPARDITLEAYSGLRMTSKEHEAILPRLTNEALADAAEHAIRNCARHPSPAITYDQFIVVVAAEMARRLAEKD